MKKLLSIAAVIFCAAAFATSDAAAQNRLKPLMDTSVNTATRNIISDPLLANNGACALQYVGTKISGTVSGKVYLQGTVDGVNFQTADSLVLADQAVNTKIFDVTGKRRLKWRLSIVTSGTMSFTNKGYWLDIK